eukprot:4012709-Ditylum_brightwellii.AAC.1
MFSCALDGQRLNLLPSISDLPSSSSIVNSWVTLFGALSVSSAPALFTSYVISFAVSSSLRPTACWYSVCNLVQQ